jgi:hypothetical protein
MKTFAEQTALQLVDALTTPVSLIGVVLVLVVIFSGLAGRVVLFLEALPARRANQPI